MNDLIVEHCLSAMEDRLARLEIACMSFVVRTGLPMSECKVVRYKGKDYPLWRCTDLPRWKKRVGGSRLG